MEPYGVRRAESRALKQAIATSLSAPIDAHPELSREPPEIVLHHLGSGCSDLDVERAGERHVPLERWRRVATAGLLICIPRTGGSSGLDVR